MFCERGTFIVQWSFNKKWYMSFSLHDNFIEIMSICYYICVPNMIYMHSKQYKEWCMKVRFQKENFHLRGHELNVLFQWIFKTLMAIHILYFVFLLISDRDIPLLAILHLIMKYIEIQFLMQKIRYIRVVYAY